MQTVKLSKPLTVNGAERDHIDLDFDSVTVEGFLAATDAAAKCHKGNIGIIMSENDSALHLQVAYQAAIAADQSLDSTDLDRLCLKDAMAMSAAGRFFTLGALEGLTLDQSDEESEPTQNASTKAHAK